MEEGSESESSKETTSETSIETTDDENEISWQSWYLSLPGNDWLVEVQEEFINDDFNLTGLSSQVEFYNEALEMILDVGPEGSFSAENMADIENAAIELFNLIHQRYLLTRNGQLSLFNKFAKCEYGVCPRAYCNEFPLFPIGLSLNTNHFNAMLFCPVCVDLYHPPVEKYRQLDGAAFGPYAVHLLGVSYPEILDGRAFQETDDESSGSSSTEEDDESLDSDSSEEQRKKKKRRKYRGLVTEHPSLTNLKKIQELISTDQISEKMFNNNHNPSVPMDISPRKAPSQKQDFDDDSNIKRTYENHIEDRVYVGRIFGFKLHSSAPGGPRMQWLRRRNLNWLLQEEKSNRETTDLGARL